MFMSIASYYLRTYVDFTCIIAMYSYVAIAITSAHAVLVISSLVVTGNKYKKF